MSFSDEVLDQAATSGGDLSLSPRAISFLSEVRKWANFLAILGFIATGAMVIFGFVFGATMSGLGAMGGMGGVGAAGGMMFGFIYLVVALIYFFPLWYLYNFASKLKTAIKAKDNVVLERSFEYLKSHYKFLGILSIIGMAFYFFGGIMMFIVGDIMNPGF